MADSTIGATSGNKTIDRSKLPQQTDKFAAIGLEQFITLMTTELQNQDPLNPMDNAQLLDQLANMQSITSTKKLTETLDAVMLGQNLSNAGGLIGKIVNGLTDAGDEVTGEVDKATLVGNVPYLNIGDKSIRISNVRYIFPPGTDLDEVAENLAQQNGADSTDNSGSTDSSDSA
jgi:flagellar basal-body rod modification protein FlgD